MSTEPAEDRHGCSDKTIQDGMFHTRSDLFILQPMCCIDRFNHRRRGQPAKEDSRAYIPRNSVFNTFP